MVVSTGGVGHISAVVSAGMQALGPLDVPAGHGFVRPALSPTHEASTRIQTATENRDVC